jgi:hypothetical protein
MSMQSQHCACCGQFASVSEELAATAEEMGGQAEPLPQLMGFFQRRDRFA